MDAAEREEHRRYQAELAQRWVIWDRRAKWRIRLMIALVIACLAVAAVALAISA